MLHVLFLSISSQRKAPQACSIELRKERRGSLDQSMVESSHNQYRLPKPDADGQPRSEAARPYTKLPQRLDLAEIGHEGFSLLPHFFDRAHHAGYSYHHARYEENPGYSSHQGGSLRNHWFKMRTFYASGDAAVVQGGAAATGNTGSGSCWPFSRGSKNDSKN